MRPRKISIDFKWCFLVGLKWLFTYDLHRSDLMNTDSFESKYHPLF